VADEQPDQTKGQDQNEEPLRKDEDPPEKRKRKVPPFVIIGVVALLIIVAGLFYWHSTYYEDTDDAQIAGNIEQISARVGGQVVNVAVLQEQKVEAGQLLVEIDPRDYQVAVQQAKGNMDSAEAAWHAAAQNVPVESVSASSGISSADADVRTATAQIDQSQKQLDAAVAQVVAAQANSKKAQLDLDRYTPLVQKDVISRQQYDQVVATADAQKAALNQAQANQLAQEQAVRVSRDRLLEAQASFRNSQTGPQQVSIQKAKADQAEATYLESKAKYEQAELNLSYTKIFAPFSGIISTKSVEVGQNVSVGQSILTLVSLDNIWVEADFKETQLRHMHTGQTVKIKVDAYGKTYTGKVTQIGGATGSLLSLFPPENATGNYVKVVQRVPVRIDFTNLKDEDKNHELRPGLSVEPTVRVKE